MKKILITIFSFYISVYAQRKTDVIARANQTSESKSFSLKVKHLKRIQNFNSKLDDDFSKYDLQVISPKSVIFSKDASKFYVHALEGFSTLVFDTKSLERIKLIKHRFKKESPVFFNDSSFKSVVSNVDVSNTFNGKPVESCLSHNGKYLWVTYYRRDYDKNALLPSALAIIDTKTDSILRVMPTDALPKMIRYNSSKKIIAVTHWGNNTVGIIDVSSENVKDFRYSNLITIGKKYTPDTDSDEKINRDKYCGHCLRGTTFSSDGNYMFVGKMSGGGIALIDMNTMSIISTIKGMKRNVRHLMVRDDVLYLSSNSDGFIQSTSVSKIIESYSQNKNKSTTIAWNSRYIGAGARTFDNTADNRFIFATVNNQSKIVALSEQLDKILEIEADSYPVGLALSPDNRLLISTSQGKKGVGGNSINIYEITYGE